MAKVTLETIESLANTSSAKQALNDNFTELASALDNTVSRDGTIPNQMEADFDLNGHLLLNVADPVSEADGVNLRSVRPLVDAFVEEIAQLLIEGTARVDTFTATAGQTQFSLTDSPGNTKSLHVFVDGLAMIPDIDFTLSGASLKTLEFFVPLAGGEEVVARYVQLAPTDGLLRSDLDNSVAGKGADLVAYTGAGAGATVRSVKDKLREIVSVEDFGAVGDGVTDDATAINAAINAVNAAGGGVVQLGPKSYKTGALSLKSGVVIRGAGMGSTEILQSGTPTHVVEAIGTLGAAVALTVDAVKGANTLTVADASAYAVGDYLILSDSHQYNPLDTNYVSGEMVRVFSVDTGTDVLTLYGNVKGSMATAGTYTTANNASIRKLGMLTGCGLEDLTITGDPTSTTGLVSMKRVVAPLVKNVRLRNGGHYGLRIDTCRDAIVSGSVIYDLNEDILNGHVAYAIVAAGANDGLNVTGCHMGRCRHGFTTIGGPDGYTHRAIIADCNVTDTVFAGLDTHASGDGIIFSNCMVSDSQQQGISIRSINTEVVDCKITRCASHGISAIEDNVRALAVRGCTVDNAGNHGFSSSGYAEGIILQGNTFRQSANDGIRINSTSLFVQILDNYISAPGSVGTNRSGITSIVSGATSARWLVARNFIRADTGSCAFGITLPNVSGSWVVDNKAFGTFSTQAFNVGTNFNRRNDVLDADVLTPAQITADQNNYSPAGLTSCTKLRVNSDAARAITGLLAPSGDGRVIEFINTGAFGITLNHESASSTAANRFLCPNNTNLAVRQNGWVSLLYDLTSARWRVQGA